MRGVNFSFWYTIEKFEESDGRNHKKKKPRKSSRAFSKVIATGFEPVTVCLEGEKKYTK